MKIAPLVWASGMASIDTIVFGALKKQVLGEWTSGWILPLGMLAYAFQPFFFLQSLNYESMTIMNILWGIISDIMVTISGLWYFKEKMSPLKYLGLSLAFVSIVILSYDELY